MAKKNKRNHYLREWREHRGMTQEQLADKVDTTKGVISDLENENRGLSTKWLMRLAPALRTTRGAILDHNPETVPTSLMEIWLDLDETAQAQALKVLETFKKTRAA